MPLDLLVPDLLAAADAPAELRAVRMPALERWLARAAVLRRPEVNLAALLASAYALDAHPPVAAVSLLAESGTRDGNWLRADPVHMRVGQDSVTLHHPSVLRVTPEEAGSLVAALQRHFAADGLQFQAPAPERWYVRVPEGEIPLTTPLEEAIGRDMFRLLPRGHGRIGWPSAITEAQMLLAGEDVNAQREARRQPAINSVWFWGEGALPTQLPRPYALVYARDPFPRGLALLSGARAESHLPAVAELDAVAEGDTVLVVLDGLAPHLHRGDLDAWAEAARRIDDSWFVNLADAVARFDSVRIILPTGRQTLVAQVTGATRWRWFRRGKPLASHA